MERVTVTVNVIWYACYNVTPDTSTEYYVFIAVCAAKLLALGLLCYRAFMPFRKIVLQNKFLTARRAVSTNNSSNKDAGSQQQQQQRQQNSLRSSKGNGSVYGLVRKVDSPSGRSGRSECVSGNSVYEAPDEQDTVAAIANTAATASVAAADTTAATPASFDAASASTTAASSLVSTASAAAASIGASGANSSSVNAAAAASALQLIAADLKQLSDDATADDDAVNAPLVTGTASDL
eukprot:6306-Heterococcus_DN1.PRE.1